MRGDLAGDPTFRALLRKTRDAALEVYAHQDLPFEMVVESIHPQRNLELCADLPGDVPGAELSARRVLSSQGWRSRRSISIRASRRST